MSEHDHQHQTEDQAGKLRGYTEEGGFGKEFDVLDLPPRRDVHETKNQKSKWKFHAIWMRFLFIILLVLIVVILSYPYWDDWFGGTFPEPTYLEESPYHEQVTVER